MNQTIQPVITLGPVDRLRRWRWTLIQARQMLNPKGSASQRQAVRSAAWKGVTQPVFILGCPRSGTTFLGKVLEVLPNASYYFEPPMMKYFTRLIYEKKVTESQIERFYRRGCQALLLAAPGTGPRLIEKNPKHTWIAEDLLRVFPDAKFLVISRDGRDVCLSLKEKPWHLAESAKLGKREPGGYLYGPQPHFYIEENRRQEYLETSDVHRCIWIWRRYAEQIEHLKETLPQDSQLHFSYEDLLLKPEETQDRMLTFLKEADDESRRLVANAASKGHVSSIGRGSKTFTEEELAIIDNEAGDMLSQLNYC